MSESLLNRTYTPPTEGTFDPLTAGITGTLPSFYTYGPSTPAPTPTPQMPQGPATGGYGEGGAGGDQGTGGLGTGDVNMGGQTAGGLDLGPNPGQIGGLSNLSDIDLSNYSLRGGLRGGMTGLSVAGPLGAAIGALIGGYAPEYSDARDRQEVARAQAQVHEDLLSDYLSQWEGSSQGLNDFTDPVSQAISNEISDAIGAGFGPESSGYGGEAQASESGGDLGGDAHKQGGLIKLAGGGLVPLAGGGKIAIGPGGGLDDLIPTSIEGRRAAALSDGEFVIPADVVSMMGDGSSNAGARRLYDLVRQVRDTKTGTTRQAGPLPVGEILKRSLGQ
jgi:hypothetical protein